MTNIRMTNNRIAKHARGYTGFDKICAPTFTSNADDATGSLLTRRSGVPNRRTS